MPACQILWTHRIAVKVEDSKGNSSLLLTQKRLSRWALPQMMSWLVQKQTNAKRDKGRARQKQAAMKGKKEQLVDEDGDVDCWEAEKTANRIAKFLKMTFSLIFSSKAHDLFCISTKSHLPPNPFCFLLLPQ
jgi:hypothetical protein